MRVAGTRGRLEMPQHPHLRVDAFDAVEDLAVGVGVQCSVGLHVFLQKAGIARQPGHLRELRRADLGRPALRAENPDVPIEVEDLGGKALPLHEVDEMGGDVDEAFALLRHVEEPRGPLDRRARHLFREVVDAFLDDGRLPLGSFGKLAEHRRKARERLLQHRGDLVPLGHDVVEEHALFRRGGKRVAQRFEARGVDRHRLVGQHVHAGFHCARDVLGLAPVVAGDHDDVTGAFRAEAVEEVGAGMDDGSPRGRVFPPRVVAVDLLQVIGEVGTVFGIDVHGRVDAGIHRLLQERGVEMTGVEDNQPSWIGPPGDLLPSGAANAVSVGAIIPRCRSRGGTRASSRRQAPVRGAVRRRPRGETAPTDARTLRALCWPPTIEKCV